jgi:hypothetical protein
MLVFSVLFCLFLSSAQAEEKYDRFEKIQNITLQTGKEGSQRHFRAFTKAELPLPTDSVLEELLDFRQSCNNDLAHKRQYLTPDHHCKRFDRDVIENIVLNEINVDRPFEEGELKRLIVGRRVYNRGEYGYYELVRVFKRPDGYRVTLELLKDKTARQLVEPKIKFDYFFHQKNTEYILSTKADSKTELKLITEASTRNWFLNKAFSVGQVFQGLVTETSDLLARFHSEPMKSDSNRSFASKQK